MNKTIGICTMEAFDNRPTNTVGSSRIRMRWLLPFWEEAEEYRMGQKYEAMIYQKVYWDKMMNAFEGVQILDLCDPDWLEGKPVFEYVDKADIITTSTSALADYIKKMRPGKVAVCVPDRIYLPEHKPRTQKFVGPIKSAVWFGYGHNVHYLTKTFDALIKHNISLTVISNEPFTPPVAFRNLRVTNVPYTYPGVHEEIIKHDILLMPPASDDLKGSFKSNNKSLTGMALGVPVVSTEDELEAMMTAEARQAKADKDLQEIKDKWDVKYSVDEYRALIKEAIERKK